MTSLKISRVAADEESDYAVGFFCSHELFHDTSGLSVSVSVFWDRSP